MPDDILNAMRGLREDMRQRLLQSPEYRALEALDAAIDEIGAILQQAPAVCASAPVASEIQIAPLQEARPQEARPQEARPQEAAPSAAAPPPSAPAVLMAPQTPAARHQAIADAFAETLAAKLDPRNGARAATAYQPARHSHFE